MKNQAITLGRIGILLPIAVIFLFWIPVIGQLLGIAPLVLLLISHHKFSQFFGSREIFSKMLIGVIINIAGFIIGSIIMVIAVGSAAVSLSGQDPESMGISQITNLLFESGLTIFAGLIMLAGLIIGIYFVFQSLKVLAEKSGIKYFKTSGLLYFIGAIGTIVFFLGGLVMFVGWIIHIVAYFSIKPDNAVASEQA